jgi:glycosyltransferase involved in cell wall biosynthesis
MADYYAAQGFRRDRVVAVYDGIDTASLRPRGRASRERVLVGWAGRFVAWKGASLLVAAAEATLSRRPDVDFVLAGAGPELEALRERVDRSELLKDRVRLPGFRGDVRDLIAGCDIFVNTSIEPEPLSHSTLEAMALGVSVVAPRCGGFPEIVAHETSGLLFEPGRSGSLADALARLVGDAPMRARFGAEGRKRAEGIFGLGRHVGAIETVYDEVLREWSGRRGRAAVTKP